MSPQRRKEKDKRDKKRGNTELRSFLRNGPDIDIERQTYSVASSFGIRAGIFRYFPRFDIMDCATFKASNDVGGLRGLSGEPRPLTVI